MSKLITAITVTGMAIAVGTLLAAAPVADKQEAHVGTTFDMFIAHVIAGQDKEALSLTDSLNEGERQLAELRQVKNLRDTRVVAIYADEDDAMGISSGLFIPNHRGNLILRAKLNGGEWKIIDLDFREADDSNDKIYADLGEFWWRHPDARPLRVDHIEDNNAQKKEVSAN